MRDLDHDKVLIVLHNSNSAIICESQSELDDTIDEMMEDNEPFSVHSIGSKILSFYGYGEEE